jgi:hypothetical protein
MESVTRGTELFSLRQQILGGRSRKSIRELIESMPTAFPLLAPCLLMSPLSIAQVSAVEHAAVRCGGVRRSVADHDMGRDRRDRRAAIRPSWSETPNQLPPTSFFERRTIARTKICRTGGVDPRYAEHP